MDPALSVFAQSGVCVHTQLICSSFNITLALLREAALNVFGCCRDVLASSSLTHCVHLGR